MKYIYLIVLSMALLMACAEQQTQHEEMAYEGVTIEKAVAVIHPTDGNSASGVVTFTQTDDGVRIQATVSGLDAESLHGFHIHEFGDCRASDATSAGGHYDPTDMPHGAPVDEERHMGDLGNLPSNEDGVAELDYVDHKVELSGRYSVLGLAVIVHEQRDDLVTQPVGDAGARIGCGIIGTANPDY
ncbi:MAG: superoxide dismutase family protein [Balneolaceae bacterium]|nr:MAG: superoxide dismutase family protein [Balneolaceae bacterium]